ncbi:acyltransferase ChoActase/COT/CPT [Athelia psychrophila]|uniref:Acyltransferase ChoActase/COT/CPT n=1 Tax=Athelia psychrophila TaxID=1759441 RepID=A0A165YSV3_9AGAM|nr:acyltransferase ChoActase/COT/CPT [Fibularhizoctonia sp. CBS 109695]
MSLLARRAMSSSVKLTTRPSNWKALAPAPLPGTTFAAQASLPKLPVPALPATLARLKQSLIPLASSPSELAAANSKIDAFAEIAGPELQKRLLKHAEGKEHWLEAWWDDLAYQSYRDSIIINVSYFYGFAPQPAHLPQSPAARAASIAHGALLFRRKLREGTLAPDVGGQCMDSFRWMFDCSRVPGPNGVDWSITHAASASHENPHIVVFRGNVPWKVQASSFADLERAFQHIYDNAADGPPVGLLPTQNRDVWAAAYPLLTASPANADIMHTIHSAAFCVSLDAAHPPDADPHQPVNFSRALWHGGKSGKALGNRWVDKPVSFVVYDDASAGIMGEHSMMDGTPTVRLCDDILSGLALPNSAETLLSSPAPASSPFTPPTPLTWEVTPETTKAIAAAATAIALLVDKQALSVVKTSYGKAAIKTLRLSPDAWAQLVIQLAYRRVHGPAPCATYEAAATRRFARGRTEAIRVVTTEVEAWVRAMLAAPAAVAGAEKRRLFEAAARRHVALAKEAGAGLGVDRHLLGLRQLLPSPSSPSSASDGFASVAPLFADPLVKRSAHWNLSTSAVFSRHFTAYGWGEVVADGYGVPYMTGFDDYLMFTVTSLAAMPNAEFSEAIRAAGEEVYALFMTEEAVAERGDKARL